MKGHYSLHTDTNDGALLLPLTPIILTSLHRHLPISCLPSPAALLLFTGSSCSLTRSSIFA
ncbi:unnamed protein product, partial [Staurois parvus]